MDLQQMSSMTLTRQEGTCSAKHLAKKTTLPLIQSKAKPFLRPSLSLHPRLPPL